MKNNNTPFIKYAIREILLVVIGILIAVSINNWNEARKQKDEVKNILVSIKDDIKNDIEEINEILEFYHQVDTIHKKVLNDSYQKEDYIANPRIAFLLLGYPEISFNQRGIKLLEGFKSDSKLLNEVLIQDILEFYTERMLEIKVDEDLRVQDFKENFTYWKNNTDWWADYLYKREITGFIDYALHSKDYRNRVATSQFLTYDVYLPELKKFKERGQDIIRRIEDKD